MDNSDKTAISILYIFFVNIANHIIIYNYWMDSKLNEGETASHIFCC